MLHFRLAKRNILFLETQISQFAHYYHYHFQIHSTMLIMFFYNLKKCLNYSSENFPSPHIQCIFELSAKKLSGLFTLTEKKMVSPANN